MALAALANVSENCARVAFRFVSAPNLRIRANPQGCINRPRIGEDFSSETSLPSFPHIGNVGITRKTMESTAELILCGS